MARILQFTPACRAVREPEPERTPVMQTRADIRYRRKLRKLSANSRRTYRNVWRKLDEWLAGRDLTDDLLAEYCEHRFDADSLAPASVRGIVNAARWRSRAKDELDPVGEQTKEVLGIVSKEGWNRGTKLARGLSADEVREMVGSAIIESTFRPLWGTRDAALLSVMYDGCLRIGELCALEIEDVSFQADGSALIVVRRSKTDPQGSGRNGYLTKRASRLLRAWIKRARIQTGPLFRPCTNTNVLDKDLHTDTVRRIIRVRARQAGVELKRVRGHSLRRGCAQELTRRGASLQDVAEIGGWKSPAMVVHYVSGERAKKNAVARFMEDD